MGTPQQPICSVDFADMWDLFPWHESGHTILCVIIRILFGRFSWKGDTMCGKGEERGSVLSVFLEMSWGMAQQDTAGVFPTL